MARPLFKAPIGHHFLSTMVHTGLLQLLMVAMAISERCTRAVPSIQEFPAKKVHVLRRVPAACSNWDKAWAWLTKVDCGTKYRLDYVTVPPREIKQYKLQYVCCDGDTDCKDADNVHSSGFNSTDDKFLAIVLGSAAACVVIIIIVFAITFYTRKTRCYTTCDQESHVYASADGDESQDGNHGNEKAQPDDVESETDQKGSEVEYAEISYPRLPRYTDIFKEHILEKEDPFNRASAPPMYSAVPAKNYVNSEMTTCSVLHANSKDGMTIISTSSPTFSERAATNFEEQRHTQHNDAAGCDGGSGEETLYYNVKEKNKRKKRSSSNQGVCGRNCKGESARNNQNGSAKSNLEEIIAERDGGTTGIRTVASSSRIRTSVPVCVEMMVKSSSASETIGKTSETVLTKQKRRSAPPGTVETPIVVSQGYPESTRSTSVSSMSRSDSNSACSVINEVVPESHRVSNTRRKNKSSKKNPQDKSVHRTSRGTNHENSNVDPNTRSYSKNSTGSFTANLSDLSNTSGSIPPSNAVVLTNCDSTSVGLESFEAEATQPTEKDSLLRPPSCQSGCENVQACEHCDYCSKYDRLEQMSPDSDVASLHIYQCLDDVRHECQLLEGASSLACPEASLIQSDFHCKSNSSIDKKDNSIGLVSQNKKQHKPAPC